MVNAMLIDQKDDVIISIEEIKAGENVSYISNEQIFSITAKNDITIYHKIARNDITKGSPVSKYGEHIGIAACDIFQGEHLHTHNIEEHREDLRK
ncbi:MAG: UxaA family hydrolase [Clostridia bacterium]